MFLNLSSTTQKLTWLFLLQCLLVPSALAELKKVDKLKAAYMYNFTKFITWPVNTVPSRTFCVHNNPELLAFLKALVESREQNGVSIKVVNTLSTDTCSIIYLTDSQGLPNDYLNQAVLISDIDSVQQAPTVFRFYEDNQKLRFEIDLAQANRLNIKISAKLLQVARLKK